MVVEVTRGPLVESVHHVAACAATPGGDVMFQTGDTQSPVFLRSTAKPFIAAAAIEAGVREAFGLEMHEIAVMAASHVAEPFHIEAVRSILTKIGLDESALQCGAQDGRPPGAIYNNCSGKHAGILALAKVLGADTASYMDAANPAERCILDFCARLSDDDPATWPVGIDGCGIPVYATSLQRAATAFARFATLTELPARAATALLVVRDAMISHPAYVAGTGEFDSLLMRAGGGAIACKSGAEGVHGTALVTQGVGLVSKALDGAARARGPSTMAALSQLGAPVVDSAEVAGFIRPIVYNRAGLAVGEIRARL